MLKTSPATIPKLMKTNPTNESTRTDKQQTHANNYNKLNQIVILEYRTNKLLNNKSKNKHNCANLTPETPI